MRLTACHHSISTGQKEKHQVQKWNNTRSWLRLSDWNRGGVSCFIPWLSRNSMVENVTFQSPGEKGYYFMNLRSEDFFKVKNLRMNVKGSWERGNLYVVVHCMQMTRNCFSRTFPGSLEEFVSIRFEGNSMYSCKMWNYSLCIPVTNI